jgi:hypothetical protein
MSNSWLPSAETFENCEIQRLLFGKVVTIILWDDSPVDDLEIDRCLACPKTDVLLVCVSLVFSKLLDEAVDLAGSTVLNPKKPTLFSFSEKETVIVSLLTSTAKTSSFFPSLVCIGDRTKL